MFIMNVKLKINYVDLCRKRKGEATSRQPNEAMGL